MKKASWNIYERDDLTNAVAESLFTKNDVNWEAVRKQFSDKSILQCQQGYRNFTRTNTTRNGEYKLTEDDNAELVKFLRAERRDWVQLRRKVPEAPMPLLLQEARSMFKGLKHNPEPLIDQLIRFLGNQ